MGALSSTASVPVLPRVVRTKVRISSAFYVLLNSQRYLPVALEDIIEWLSSANFRSVQSDTVQKHVAGTGTWLLEDDGFKNWTEGKIKVFWITGMRECYKSMLLLLLMIV